MRIEDRVHSLTYEWSATMLYGTAVGIGLLLVWIWYSCVYMPLSLTVDAYQAQIGPMNAHVATYDDCQKISDALSCEVDALAQSVAACTKKCTIHATPDAVIAYLFSICEMHGIVVQLCKPLEVTKHESYTKEAFSFNFFATHDVAQKLFEAVRSSSSLIGITQMTSTLDKDGMFLYICRVERMVL